MFHPPPPPDEPVSSARTHVGQWVMCGPPISGLITAAFWTPLAPNPPHGPPNASNAPLSLGVYKVTVCDRGQ